MAESTKRPRQVTVYIANGSRYQIKLCVPQTKMSYGGSLHDTDASGIVDTTGQSIIIGVGEVIEVPLYFKYLSIFLRDAKNTEVLHNWRVGKNKPSSGDMSIIVTEEGSVQFGYLDKLNSNRSDPDWIWISKPNNVNHRPKKCFVANTSRKKITVRRTNGNGECVNIKRRETATIEYSDVEITDGNKSFRVKPKERTSIVVFQDKYKVTGQLHGECIEEEKWKVDGENYKPPSYLEIAKSLLSW